MNKIITIDLPLVDNQVDFETHVWITNQGKRLKVREMETSHIRNCIRCWKGKGRLGIPAGYLGGKDKWLKIFNDELINRQ